MLLPIAGLLAGLLATPQRRVLRTPYALYAFGAAAVLLAPNIVWQASHDWPIVEVLRGDVAHRHAFANGFALGVANVASNALLPSRSSNCSIRIRSPRRFGSPASSRPTASFRSRDLRFVTIAYVVILLAAVALSAKGYYIVGIYASLFAIGAVAIERAVVGVRVTIFALLAAVGLFALPLSLPVLPVDGLIGYSKLLGLTGRDASPAHLVQPVFAEEFGWRRLARDVATVYFSLPPDVRKQTAIYADTYGDAGALDFFGPAYGLPPVISSQNNYYLWGTRGYDGSTLVAIGATRIDLLRHFYRSVELVRTSAEPYKWVVEGPAPIYILRDPIAPLPVIWPQLRWYGA